MIEETASKEKNVSTKEERKILSFLDEKSFLKRLYPILEDNFVLSSEICECHVRKFSNEYSEEQLELIVQMLEREVKVKEFNRTFFLSTLTVMFALSTVMFTLLSNAITARSELDPSAAPVLGLAVFILSPIIIIISYNSFVSDKSYRRTNRLLLFVSIAKKYKKDTNIL